MWVPSLRPASSRGPSFADFDSEELEKELDILLQDTTKDPPELPDSPPETLQTNSVPHPRISDAELEAELEKLSLSEGGRSHLPVLAAGLVPL